MSLEISVGSTSHEESSPDSRSASSSGASRRTGICKWFNVLKGWGFITPDDGGPEVFVHQSVLKMPGFRSLGEGERVEFESRMGDKGVEATIVEGVGGITPKGSEIRPLGKKKFRKIRCFNCGEFGTHVASKCRIGPQPKCCYECKSTDHLVANCPLRQSPPTSVESATSGGEDGQKIAKNGGKNGTAADSSGVGSSGSSEA